MTLLHMGGLLLGYGAEDGVPEARYDTGNIQRDGSGPQKVVRPGGGIQSETRPPSYRRG